MIIWLASYPKSGNTWIRLFLDSLFSSSKEFNIKLHKFGTFYNKTTPERIGRNPKTLEVYKIKTSRRLSFRPSNSVKENIN